MRFYAYILINLAKTKRYKGHTQNLKTRLIEHNSGVTKSTKGDTWELEYFEEFDTRAEAIKREKYFKTSAGRRWIKKNLKEI